MDERKFRKAMSQFATGVTVVTMEDGSDILGMTANAFMSVSLEPKLIAVSVGEQASMFEKMKETSHFGVSILKEDQKDLSKYFASQTDLDYDVEFIKRAGVPVLKQSLASISCKVNQKVVAGDHIIYIGEVQDIIVNEGEPLLYFNSNYHFIK